NPFFQRNWKALTRRVCGSVSELRQIIEGHRWHSAFADIVVAHIESPCIDTELPRMLLMRPSQIVVDLPLRDLTALRIGIVMTADRGERNTVAAGRKHDGECPYHLRIVIRLEDARIPARARI